MAQHKKSELPKWFPFALIASGVLVIGAGIRSKWKLPADQPAPTPPGPPQQAGVLHEWAGAI